jgi:hypothetical protein
VMVEQTLITLKINAAESFVLNPFLIY